MNTGVQGGQESLAWRVCRGPLLWSGDCVDGPTGIGSFGHVGLGLSDSQMDLDGVGGCAEVRPRVVVGVAEQS